MAGTVSLLIARWYFNPGLSEKELREAHPGTKSCPFSNHEPRAYNTFMGWRVGCEFCGIRTAPFNTLDRALRQRDQRFGC